MGSITLELFVSVIESIRLQFEKDKEHAFKVAALHNIDEAYVSTYNHDLLVKSLVNMLRVYFPKKDNHCEIEHYMYELNFGKMGDKELVTPEDLWHRLKDQQLISVAEYKLRFEPIVSTHPLIDDQHKSFLM